MANRSEGLSLSSLEECSKTTLQRQKIENNERKRKKDVYAAFIAHVNCSRLLNIIDCLSLLMVLPLTVVLFKRLLLAITRPDAICKVAALFQTSGWPVVRFMQLFWQALPGRRNMINGNCLVYMAGYTRHVSSGIVVFLRSHVRWEPIMTRYCRLMILFEAEQKYWRPFPYPQTRERSADMQLFPESRVELRSRYFSKW